MRRYSHAFRVLMDRELFNLLAEASAKTGIPKSRFVRYAIQPFSYTELAPGTTDWNDVYRTDPDPEHPLKQGRQLNVMLTGDEYEMLCRAAFKLGIARSAWVRERVYALLCRSYADELSPLTDASIMDIHMEMPIKSKVSKLDGLYIQSEPASSRALRRWSNNPSAEGSIISNTRKEETDGEKKTKQAKRATRESGAYPRR